MPAAPCHYCVQAALNVLQQNVIIFLGMVKVKGCLEMPQSTTLQNYAKPTWKILYFTLWTK